MYDRQVVSSKSTQEEYIYIYYYNVSGSISSMKESKRPKQSGRQSKKQRRKLVSFDFLFLLHFHYDDVYITLQR